jgi:hypothetical protein
MDCDGKRSDDSSLDSVGERAVYQVIWPSTNQSRIQRGVIKASLVWVLLLLAGVRALGLWMAAISNTNHR